MTEPSGYSPRSFRSIADRPTLYDGWSRYRTTQATPYTAGQSGYTFGPFGPVADHRPLTPACPSMRTQNRELHNTHNSHTHRSNIMVPPPATHYNHTIPTHGHMVEYCSTTREPERYRAGASNINRTSNTHLRHPWVESR
jgi:hypothetical protein